MTKTTTTVTTTIYLLYLTIFLFTVTTLYVNKYRPSDRISNFCGGQLCRYSMPSLLAGVGQLSQLAKLWSVVSVKLSVYLSQCACQDLRSWRLDPGTWHWSPAKRCGCVVSRTAVHQVSLGGWDIIESTIHTSINATHSATTHYSPWVDTRPTSSCRLYTCTQWTIKTRHFTFDYNFG